MIFVTPKLLKNQKSYNFLTYLLTHSIPRAAQQFPDKDAFRCMNQVFTYRELEQKSNQLAHQLIELEVQKGDRVGIFLNRCLDTALAIYGILNAGAVYVPIDPNLPVSRIEFLIQDCGIQHLVTNPAQRRSLKRFIPNNKNLKTLIGIEQDWEIPSISWEKVFNMPISKPDVSILEDDLAYILYTSGSTGTPKGIMHTHRSGLAYAELSVETYDLKSSDRFGNHAPIFFDISTLAYFAAPLLGATVIIATDAHVKMPASLSQLIEKEKITIWYSVPLAQIQMLQLGALVKRDWSNLRWMLYAGEAFPIKHLSNLMEQLPHIAFSNLYGPTETNVCTYYHLPEIPDENTSIPIGKVWGNTEMLILDEDNQEVEQGEVGELLIRSATRMLGYWNKPEMTERSSHKREKIAGIEDVFYRTGDLVRAAEDGNLMLVGRKDRQVKTRGFRVELDEIETTLLAHEMVNEAAVFTIISQDDTLFVAAAVTLKEKHEIEEKELLDYCKNKLAWYAVPQQLSILKDLPRTPTGKIDRKQLRIIDG